MVGTWAGHLPYKSLRSPGPWERHLIFTGSRSMPINGLTPGGNYQFQIRAVGGSTGYSDWSDAVSQMSL